uniref:Uncharacterized protein n=1 Tax=Lepeophtheirus salmonis TaxID=72036 RepID=A0A0K2VJP0_LEPSM
MALATVLLLLDFLRASATIEMPGFTLMEFWNPARKWGMGKLLTHLESLENVIDCAPSIF